MKFILDTICSENRAAAERFLLEGFGINAADESGWTVLHMAAIYGRTEAAAYLLALGADVNASNVCGVTPLHSAVCEGHAEVVALLVKAGADVNAVNSLGLTPLKMALIARKWDIAALLGCEGFVRKYPSEFAIYEYGGYLMMVGDAYLIDEWENFSEEERKYDMSLETLQFWRDNKSDILKWAREGHV